MIAKILVRLLILKEIRLLGNVMQRALLNYFEDQKIV